MKKGEFLSDLIQSNPDIKYKEAVAAWQDQGNEDKISQTTFSKIKKAVQKSGRRRGRPKGTRQVAGTNGQTSVAAKMTTRTNTQSSTDAIEADLDRVIFRLMEMDGTEEIQETLRSCRRQIVLLS